MYGSCGQRSCRKQANGLEDSFRETDGSLRALCVESMLRSSTARPQSPERGQVIYAPWIRLVDMRQRRLVNLARFSHFRGGRARFEIV